MVQTIAVIGAGQMGNGIAHVCALAGYQVLLHDLTEERVRSGLATIDGNLARQVHSGRIAEEDRKAALERIRPARGLEDLADVDIAIESATESEPVKRKIFAELCPLLKPEAMIATNTSSISITRLAAATDRPAKFIGMHFMNPVPVMQLVELIRGLATDVLDEGASGRAPALAKDGAADVLQVRPPGRCPLRDAAHLGDPDGAVEGDPGHERRVRVADLGATDLPDAVVGRTPLATGRLHQLAAEALRSLDRLAQRLLAS